MLTSAATFSLLASMAAAAAVQTPQQLLVQDATIPTINQTTFRKFAIEDMSDAKFRLHHHAAKTLLGEDSYLLLRTAELDARENDIWQYLWENEWDCGDWYSGDGDEDEDDHYTPKVYMSDGRVFDADPKSVPQQVIDALEKLSESEWKVRRELQNERYCNANVNHTNDASDEHFGKSSKTDAKPVSEPKWKAEVPEQYLQYLIPESVLQEERKASVDAWKAKDEKHKQDILAGRVSVRNTKMPDLLKCEKMEPPIFDDEY
ncbi:unnamed protein product [Aureobasidium mustum]|uniref:Uncharacterized protein n=1 Tax=Aureobasidium mustum TaxID=2773714 RepID=A0A9N8K182_9PEZI|nr:unnamed protein product [Aureobasidium mustum]